MSANYIDRLTKLMPPIIPAPDNQVDWQLAADVFGFDFPDDFQQLVSIYGNVIWCNLFRLNYPETGTRAECEASRDYALELLSNICGDRLYNAEGKIVDMPGYPEPEGLFPCIVDTNTDFVLWHTKGDPNSWTSIKYEVGNIFFFPMGIAQLICEWIERVPTASEVWGANFLEPEQVGIAR